MCETGFLELVKALGRLVEHGTPKQQALTSSGQDVVPSRLHNPSHQVPLLSKKADSPSSPIEDFLASGTGLVAEYVGGISLGEVCSASSSTYNAVMADLQSKLVLQARPRLTGWPYAESWGLEHDLDLLLRQGAKGCSDAHGAVVIGPCGLRHGRAAFHFSMQDFPGSLVGVTTQTFEDSPNFQHSSLTSRDQQSSSYFDTSEEFKFLRSLDVRESVLFSLGGGQLTSANQEIRQVNMEPFTQWPITQDTVADVVFSVDSETDTILIEASACDGYCWSAVVKRPASCKDDGRPLFPIVAATHLAQSMELHSGRAMCERIVA